MAAVAMHGWCRCSTGRRCLELGCGAGVVGVCLSRAGAADVVCTDGDMETVANCRRNLEANGLRVSRDCQISDGQEAKPTEVAACVPATSMW